MQKKKNLEFEKTMRILIGPEVFIYYLSSVKIHTFECDDLCNHASMWADPS